MLWDPADWSVSSPTPEWLFDIFCRMHGISKDERKNYYLTPNLTSTGTKTFVVNENVKTMKLKLVATDIDIDSDNDNGLAMPDENSDEEKLEDEPDHPGKAIAINGLDRDKDAVPDFADGYNIDHGEDDQSDSDNGDEDQSGSDNGDGDQSGTDKSHDFVPVVLKFSDSIPLNEATVKFKCRDLSDPDKVSREGDGSAEKPYKYSIDDGGRVRLWRKNGSEAREKAQVPSGDAILHNTEVRLDKLDTDGDRRVELYLEGLAGSSSLGDINIKAEVDPDGPDGAAPYLCQDSIKATVFYVESVHPQASDFEDGEEGKVMISTEQDDKYYTKQDTTKAGKPAQTSDGEVTISAYIKPKPPEDYSGVTTYFEVTDPDDLSHYEGKSSPGKPNKQGDKNPNDNHDGPLGMSGPTEIQYDGYQASALSDLSAPVELSTIDSNEYAVAETTLNITDHCSGDNYQVRATLRNPVPSGETDICWPFDTLSGTTPQAPKVKSGVRQSAKLVAWKRIYIEQDNMYKEGCTVTAAKGTDTDNNDDTLSVDSSDDFSGGDDVVIFWQGGKHNTQVVDTGSGSVTVRDLPMDVPQWAGIRPKKEPATYQLDLSALPEAFGESPDGSDGGTFVEFDFKTLSSGSDKIPKYAELPTPEPPIKPDGETENFSEYWYDNSGDKTNCMQLVAANVLNPPEVTGWSESDSNSNIAIIAVSEQSSPQSKRLACAHELGHLVGGLGVADNLHVDLADGKKHPDHMDAGTCIMDYDKNASDGYIEFCIKCCTDVRDASDPK